MSKTQAVRAALTDLSAGEDLDIAGIRAATGDPSITANHIKCMIKSGEVIVSGSGHKHRYRLNPSHTTTQQRNAERALPIKRKKKPARKATKKRTTRIRKLAEAIATAPPPVAPRHPATDRRQQTAAHHHQRTGRGPRHQPAADRRAAQRRAGGIAG